MTADLFETVVGLLLCPLLYVLPGYALGMLTDLFGFRSRSMTGRVAIAVGVSIAVAPILTHLLLYPGWMAVLSVYGAAALAGFVYFVRDHSLVKQSGKSLLLCAGVCTVIVLLVVDIGWGDKLYFSVVARDYLKHFALTDVIQEVGTPPTNPFFFDGEPSQLYYYYGWLLLTSTLDIIGVQFVGPRGAVFATTAITGIGLMATVALYAQSIRNPVVKRGDVENRIGGNRRWGRQYIALVLLLVGGLDLLVFLVGMAGLAILGMPIVFTDIEWWNEPVFLWITSILTVPHHVTGLIAALIGFRVARWTVEMKGIRHWVGILIAGAAFASTALCSIWIAIGAVVVVCCWIILNGMRGEWLEIRVWVIAGFVAVALAVPYLFELIHAGTSEGSPLRFGVHYFGPLFRYLDIGRDGFNGVLHLLFLPVWYPLELGFIAITGWLYVKARRRVSASYVQDERLLVTILCVGLIVPVFFYSAIRMNDLGFRVPMFGQFVLVVWTAFLIEGWKTGSLKRPSRRLQRFLVVLACIGLASTIANGLVIRFVPPAADTGLISMPGMYSQDHQLGERTASMRETYEWIQENTPKDAIIQHNPKPGVARTDGGLAFPPALYSARQFAVYDDDMGTLFSIPLDRYSPVAEEIATIFERTSSAELVSDVSARHHLTGVVVTDRDSVWQNTDSWVWTEDADFVSDHARVYLNPAERF